MKLITIIYIYMYRVLFWWGLTNHLLTTRGRCCMPRSPWRSAREKTWAGRGGQTQVLDAREQVELEAVHQYNLGYSIHNCGYDPFPMWNLLMLNEHRCDRCKSYPWTLPRLPRCQKPLPRPRAFLVKWGFWQPRLGFSVFFFFYGLKFNSIL